MKTNNIIIALVGSISSGKGTVADYVIKNYNASSYTFSTMLKDVLKRFYLEINRDNLVKISEQIRGTFGEETMAKTMSKDVENDDNNVIVIDGVRRMADIEYLQKLEGFVLVNIHAEPKTRHSRMLERNEKADDSTKTYEEFLADGQRSTEISILDVAKHATEEIDNNGSLEDLYKQVDKLVEKYTR